MDMEIAEQAAKGQMLIFAQMLVAKKDHQILGERPVQLVEPPIAERG
jgi:hypothetical protein